VGQSKRRDGEAFFKTKSRSKKIGFRSIGLIG
jgi:hypothetical protein